MKIDTTFVRMRSTDHFGNVKMSEEAPCFVEFNFLPIAMDKNSVRRIKEEGQIYKILGRTFKVLLQDLVMFFQSLVMILTPFFDIQRP